MGYQSRLLSLDVLRGFDVYWIISGQALIQSPVYPIIKNYCTVTYIVMARGLSLMLLVTFYYLIDLLSCTKGIGFYFILIFKVIGLNLITIYLGAKIIPFSKISEFFLGWLITSFGELIIILETIILEWILLYYLYKNKIFLIV